MPSKHQKGMISILEITIAVGILVTLTSIIVFFLKPIKNQKRGRDIVRINDLLTLTRAIEEYKLDKNSYPDVINTTRTSSALPAGNTGPETNPLQGWIDADFNGYLTKLPIDPINSGSLVYTYRTDGSTYELNAILEFDNEKLMQNDGGNNTAVYEVGTKKTLMN